MNQHRTPRTQNGSPLPRMTTTELIERSSLGTDGARQLRRRSTSATTNLTQVRSHLRQRLFETGDLQIWLALAIIVDSNGTRTAKLDSYRLLAIAALKTVEIEYLEAHDLPTANTWARRTATLVDTAEDMQRCKDFAGPHSLLRQRKMKEPARKLSIHLIIAAESMYRIAELLDPELVSPSAQEWLSKATVAATAAGLSSPQQVHHSALMLAREHIASAQPQDTLDGLLLDAVSGDSDANDLLRKRLRPIIEQYCTRSLTASLSPARADIPHIVDAIIDDGYRTTLNEIRRLQRRVSQVEFIRALHHALHGLLYRTAREHGAAIPSRRLALTPDSSTLHQPPRPLLRGRDIKRLTAGLNDVERCIFVLRYGFEGSRTAVAEAVGEPVALVDRVVTHTIDVISEAVRKHHQRPNSDQELEATLRESVDRELRGLTFLLESVPGPNFDHVADSSPEF